MKDRKLGRILVPFTVDSVQQEALDTLKKLKVPFGPFGSISYVV